MGQKLIKNNEINDADKFKNQKIETIIDIENFNTGLVNDNDTSDGNQVKSKKLRNYIIKTIVQPTYIFDLKDTLKWRFRWRKIGNILYIVSKLLTIVGAVLAFSETYFQVTYLALASGIITLLGVLILQLGDSSQKESKRKTHEANDILKSLNIDGVPELDDEAKNNDNNNNDNKDNKDNKDNIRNEKVNNKLNINDKKDEITITNNENTENNLKKDSDHIININ